MKTCDLHTRGRECGNKAAFAVVIGARFKGDTDTDTYYYCEDHVNGRIDTARQYGYPVVSVKRIDGEPAREVSE